MLIGAEPVFLLQYLPTSIEEYLYPSGFHISYVRVMLHFLQALVKSVPFPFEQGGFLYSLKALSSVHPALVGHAIHAWRRLKEDRFHF